VAGAVLIPFGVILNELTSQPHPQRAQGQAIEQAWLYVFAWLGLLMAGFAVAAWARRRRPEAGWKPGPVPTDRTSRPGRAAAIVFFVLGTLALVNPAWLIRTVSGGRAASAAYQAFAYDEGFLRLRGPVVLSLMIAGLVILAILLWEGRWRPWIRQAEMVHSLAVCIVLTWVVAGGPVFTATPTDRAMKGAASLIVLVTLIDLAVRTRRHRVRQAMEIRECPPLTE
jgi:4-amino-4-deoxy-L-arabinose transferase-like glycosyltransferase